MCGEMIERMEICCREAELGCMVEMRHGGLLEGFSLCQSR
jgi:hypothetical protein